jgi:LL-diaminopimelate aminotransferase
MLFCQLSEQSDGRDCDGVFLESACRILQTHILRLIVCHDHAYSEMTFGDYVAPSFLQYTQNAVEMHSLSKVFNATGFRIGFCVGRADYIAAIGESEIAD